MPQAAILFLRAQHDGAIYGATGQHAAGFWLNSWREIAAEVGDTLHDDRPLRQFTISPLLGLTNVRRGVTLVSAGSEARLRLTTLDDREQVGLLTDWLLRLPAETSIGGVGWRFDGLALAPADHPGAGVATYAMLRDRYRDGRPAPARWSLCFETPTAFHIRGESYLPFPLPGLLVAGWLNRWNEYAPFPLLAAGDSAADFLGRVEKGLRISVYRLKTVSFRFRHEGPGGGRSNEVPQIGCVGDVTLDGTALAPADRAAVSSLVDFAFYCGSGHHTTMGMGQTRIMASDE
jgi:CRISPR-associated endoribonuclease Cas6